jgi:hypothetical protein
MTLIKFHIAVKLVSYAKIIVKFKNKIKNYLSFQSVKSQTYFARRLNPNKKAKVDIKGNPENVKLSKSDLKLINLLKKNSRMP